MDYRKLNNITGWVIFSISTLVYILTLEPTASYWDCGEFIAVAYKLEVSHPPGAPLFMLIGRMFSFLAMGDVTEVAYWINFSSALSSGFTILFLFWTITMLGQKLFKIDRGQETKEQTILLLASGAIGALAYTFSDSFWFSAVEAEVYALSSFFTAFVFWAVLKWELIEDEVKANKWLIMIAYTIGLSIGVHLLNLVCLPALGLLYYFKKFKNPNIRGIIITLIIGISSVLLINSGVIVGLPVLAGKFEIFFVNNLGLPFGSGAAAFVLIIFAAIIYGLRTSHKKGNVNLNTALLAFTFILIGYSSYSVILIRSNYNPPIDENNPEDVMTFISYLKREQYGELPSLIYGRQFTAELVGSEKGAPVYAKGEDDYEIVDYKTIPVYDDAHKTLFPRAWSGDAKYADGYRSWMGLEKGEKPTFGDNLEFFLRYQISYSYLRYFWWNFVGRDSDVQGAYAFWPWETFRDLPELLAENKGRNNFFMLPLLLGFLGVFFHYRRNPKDFSVVTLLFILTGLALVVYLNIPSSQPRERDYIYVGSYYAFAIWIGIGVMALSNLLDKFISKKSISVGLASIVSLSVPLIMAAEGWDDHDRSNRYFSVDSAKNFLASCAPNAILFTGGDNDTFPLWYVQEVEGFRTDVRVIVQSYFNTDWYVNQMTRQAYESDPLPFSLGYENFRQGTNDYLPYVETNLKGAINSKTFIRLIKEKNPNLQRQSSSGSTLSIVPAKEFFLNVNKQDVINKGIIPTSMEEYVVDRMNFNLKGSYLGKADLMTLDLIASNNWERPIYFNNTSRRGINLTLDEYLVQEGNAYRLLPVKNPQPNTELVNTDLMYTNLIENFHYRELDNPNVNYNMDYRNFVLNHRSTFNTLGEALIREGKTEKAKEVLLKSLELMPDKAVPYDFFSSQTVGLLAQVGAEEQAEEMAEILAVRADEMLSYMEENDIEDSYETRNNLVTLRQLQAAMKKLGNDEAATRYEEMFSSHFNQF
ncbi:MAG: DUF2723 domain-containing protein [Bacteroidota bacterium]